RLENLVASVQEGELYLKKGGLNASLSEMRRWVETGVREHIWFEAELRNVGVRLDAKEALPLRGVQGHITLRKGLIVVTGGEANYGGSRLSRVNGTYAPGERELALHAWGDLELAELREQLKLGIYTTEAATMASSLQELGGRARGNLSLRLVKDAPLQMQGKLALDSVRLRKDSLSLTDITGDLDFSAREIKGERIKALISGSPIQIDLLLKDYGSVDGMFDLRVDSTGIKAGALTRLLLSSGSVQDPGIVRGAVRYQGSLSDKENRKFTGTMDLINVQLKTQPLLQPIRELNGKVKIDETGIDFQNLQGLLVGFPSSVNGRWRYAESPQLVFDFAAPNLDITYLISQVDAESSDFYANLQAQGRIALAKGKIKDLEFGDLKTAVTIDHRVWRLTDLTARAAGGTVQAVTIIADRPDSLGITADSTIQGVPVQSFLRWFDMTTTEMTGRVKLTGSLQTNGNDDAERKRNLSGAFNLEIDDGTIHRMRIVVQILNLLDLSRWFTLQLPDLAKQGIRFRKITGDFKVNKGVYRTENLLVDSDDLRMTGAGKIDVSKDEVEFVVAVRPFAGIDSAIHHIPLLGRGIAAIKNSFLVASFNIKGPIEDPAITPAPLGTVSEWFWGVLGIPKNLIGLGDGEKKNEIKAPPQ
ncbi:MAG: AsmA-like C-terminal domain-containing protein, partial [Candidatus Binatia bacterium]